VAGRGDHPRADLGVTAHQLPLVVRERPALLNHPVRQRHPAHVVEDPCEPDPLDGVGREPELTRGQLGQPPDTVAVGCAAGFAHVERLREAEQCVQPHATGAAAATSGRRALEDAWELGARDHGTVAAERLRRVERLVRRAQQRVGRLPARSSSASKASSKPRLYSSPVSGSRRALSVSSAIACRR
jgi:hypothetical protein